MAVERWQSRRAPGSLLHPLFVLTSRCMVRDSKSQVACSAPLYINTCPEWGMNFYKLSPAANLHAAIFRTRRGRKGGWGFFWAFPEKVIYWRWSNATAQLRLSSLLQCLFLEWAPHSSLPGWVCPRTSFSFPCGHSRDGARPRILARCHILQYQNPPEQWFSWTSPTWFC